MNKSNGSKAAWGWLRLFLGTVQIVLATAALVAAVSVGAQPITCLLVGGALTATLVSRLLYRGKARPD